MKTLRLSSYRHTIVARNPLAFAALCILGLSVAREAHGQAIAIAAPGTFTQNFDGLGTTTTAWVDNGTLGLGVGWYAGINSNATADGNLQATDGGTNGVDSPLTGLLNLGVVADGDRALGSKVTGTGGFANIAFGVLFQNTSGAPVQVTNIGYTGELWHANSVAATAEIWSTFYKVSSTLFTDTEPGGSNGAANVGSFTSLGGMSFTFPTFANNASLNGNLAANRVVRSVSNPGIILAPGEYFMFRWVDPNQANLDGYQGIDDFSISFASFVAARNLTYNLAHTAGGAPNGSIELTANQYWLNGAAPAAFLASDNIAFSQDGTANINVPTNVSAASVTVSANSGTYTIGGAGILSSASLTKSGNGTLVLTSANSFSNTTLGGGTVITNNVNSLGSGGLNVTGPTTLTTNTNLTLSGAINGAGALTKNGTGILTVAGTGSATGGILVEAGGLRADTAAALGGNSQLITLSDGTSLEFTGGAGVFSAAGNARILVGNGTNTITVGGAGALEFQAADTLVSAGTLIKNGTGTLRTTVDQNFLQAAWVVNDGFLELQTNGGLGTGDIQMNGGVLVVRGNPAVTLPNNVTLNGGALGTRSGDAGVVAGNVNVTGNSFINLKSTTTPTNPQTITISGPISGNGNLTITGNIPLTAGGRAAIFTNPANTYSGNITVTSQQTLASESVAASGSALGAATITLGGGTLRILDNGVGDNGTLAYGNNIAVIDPTDVGLPGVATITLDHALGGLSNANTVAFGSLTMGAQVLNITGSNNYKATFTNGIIGGAATLNANTKVTVSGPVTGTGIITKDGPGTLELNGAGDANVDIVVNAGTLQGTGDVGGDVNINGGASIGAGGDGTGTGIFDIGGNLTLASGATTNVQLADGLPGLNYDLVNVGIGAGAVSTGSIDLGGSTLNATAASDIDLGDLFFIFNNDGTDPITGTFAGMTDNSIIVIGTQEFRITYDADFLTATLDGGNDVALLAVPEPGSAALLLLGAGLLVRRRRSA